MHRSCRPRHGIIKAAYSHEFQSLVDRPLLAQISRHMWYRLCPRAISRADDSLAKNCPAAPNSSIAVDVNKKGPKVNNRRVQGPNSPNMMVVCKHHDMTFKAPPQPQPPQPQPHPFPISVLQGITDHHRLFQGITQSLVVHLSIIF